MIPLIEQLTGMDKRRSTFEDAVRQLPLPVCPAFVANGALRPVIFERNGVTLDSQDSQRVSEQFPRSVALSGNVVLHGTSG